MPPYADPVTASAFAVKPELPAPFPNVQEFWTCPKTGFVVPKDPTRNLQWRAEMLTAAASDEDLQQNLLAACSQSLIFWVNAFAYTFVVQEVNEAGERRQAQNKHVPFVTWEIQDKHLAEIEDAIANGKELLTDKTRDMGASWIHIAAIHWFWLFRPDFLALEMSRVEDDVDSAKNPKCLFVKHDYLNKWLPEWMLPRIDRSIMHIINLDNGSRIDGESSNEAAGSGDRRSCILLDEFAKMNNAEKIKSSTADVSPCRLVNSTPWGPGTAYSRWRNSGQIKVFSLPWYEHPDKGRGRTVEQEEATGKWKITSPWYKAQQAVRSPKEMAQEIDMDHIGSGDTYFEAHVIEQHKTMFAKPAVWLRSIDFKRGIALDAIPDILLRRQLDKLMVVGSGGAMRGWVTLIDNRLDQHYHYIVGADISKGQGASNSVLAIYCKETGEKVAEWADANTPPYDFARIACAVCVWVGGRGGLPLLIWEANGPGWDFGREVVKKYQYPNFFTDHASGTTDEKGSKRYGWHSSAEKKESCLGAYRRSLAHGAYINHSTEALTEALTYIYFNDGGIGPSHLLEESSMARKTHGDRVIADMLSLHGAGKVYIGKTVGPVAPHRSPAARKKAWDEARKEERSGKRFDFSRVEN